MTDHPLKKRHDLLSSELLNRKPMKHDILNSKRTHTQPGLPPRPSTRKRHNRYKKWYISGSVLSLLAAISVIYFFAQPAPHSSQQVLASEEDKMDSPPSDQLENITVSSEPSKPPVEQQNQNTEENPPPVSVSEASTENTSSKDASVESSQTSEISTSTKATSNTDSPVNTKPDKDQEQNKDNSHSVWGLVKDMFWTKK